MAEGYTSQIFFDEYNNMFETKYDINGTRVDGILLAVDTSDREAIILVLSEEIDAFLTLRFCNNTNVVKINYR